MKKFLIGTTALVSILSGAAFAEDAAVKGPSVKIGGTYEFQAGTRKQKSDYNANITQNNKNTKLSNEARVYVYAENMADAGFKYGANITLATEAQNRQGKDSTTLDNTYLFLDSGVGRVELGSNYSASRAMSVSSCSFSRGTGSAACGDWTSFTNQNTPNNNFRFLTTSGKLPGDSLSGTKEQTRKVTLYTPRVNGFQAGVSYTPDSTNIGDGNGYVATISPRSVKDHWSGGFNYSNQFDELGFNASLVGELAQGVKLPGDTINHKLKGWQAGASISYAGFKFGGSYGSSDKRFFQVEKTLTNTANTVTGLAVTQTASGNIKNVTYWDVGASFTQGPASLSTHYMASNFQNNKATAIGVAADYQLAPGILPYVEATFFNLKAAKNAAPKNKGQAYLFGTVFKF